MENVRLWVAGYLLVVNVLGMGMMWADKKKAIRHEYRIAEKSLFLISLIGGSIGTWAGMYLFRHKTRHWYFVIGMPLILAAQIGLIVCWYLK